LLKYPPWNDRNAQIENSRIHFDKYLLFVGGSIGNAVLYVKKILAKSDSGDTILIIERRSVSLIIPFLNQRWYWGG